MGTSSKLFIRLIWVTLYMLLLEIVSWQFDQKAGLFNWYANYISNMLFAWSSPLITCIWCAYIDYHIFNSFNRLKQRRFYLQPMIINSLLIGINLFTPFIFSVSQNNIYKRESFMWLIVILNSVMLFYMWYIAIKNWRTINREVISAMLIFVILPSIAAVIQMFLYGVFVLWPTMAVTIVITYIFLETNSTSKDYLTGLLSRSRMDNYIDYKIENNQQFGIVMLDLDEFKLINDTFGHIQGDNALKLFSKALMIAFHETKLIGRYAGDEFIILTEPMSEEEIELVTNRLEFAIHKIESDMKIPFQIEFSLGYETWNKESEMDYQTLVNITDLKMYEQKTKKKIKI